MKVTVSKTLHVNLGNFEWVEIRRAVEYDDSEMTTEDAISAIDELMLPDVRQAALATSIPEADNDTCVYEYQKMMEDH